ncbi:MAG: hypothetical protein COB66_04255 [Coxiella sp. (in: Bacteria)]|nr:MAG: hypothetical protein COB66_04255 [Coxiella sp. (in: g-proteobacteria)]
MKHYKLLSVAAFALASSVSFAMAADAPGDQAIEVAIKTVHDKSKSMTASVVKAGSATIQTPFAKGLDALLKSETNTFYKYCTPTDIGVAAQAMVNQVSLADFKKLVANIGPEDLALFKSNFNQFTQFVTSQNVTILQVTESNLDTFKTMTKNLTEAQYKAGQDSISSMFQQQTGIAKK